MSFFKKSVLVAALAGAVTGCAMQPSHNGTTDTVASPYSAANSREVAIMPYTSQGVEVEGSTTWYYGRNDGMRAYPTMAGVRYVEPEQVNYELQRLQLEERLKAAEQGLAKASQELLELTAPKPKAVEVFRQRQQPVAAKSDITDIPKGKWRPEIKNAVGSKDKLLSISFFFNKTDKLYRFSSQRLDAFIEEHKGKPYKTLVIVGYTDDVGLDDINIPFSMRRAEWVASKLKASFPNTQLLTFGSGAEPRVADNRKDGGRAANRRVEIYGEL